MSISSAALSQFSISNKMQMGWISKDDIRLVDFQKTIAIDEPFTIHASELGTTPNGMCKAVEARLADGWTYFIEYRSKQPGSISDQWDSLSPSRAIVITDVIRDKAAAPTTRPPILFVHKDAQGDGPVLDDVDDDFLERNPTTHLLINVKVIALADDHAKVQVQYGSQGWPELGIRPWREGRSDWKSPDIKVRNAKSDEDADYINVPWLGHKNRITATVRNSGTINAIGVVVHFYMMQHSTGEGPKTFIGAVQQDVPSDNRPVDFEMDDWVPPGSVPWFTHFCVTAEIQPYQDPVNPLLHDFNPENNVARSNFMNLYSGSSSPAYRTGTQIRLANPFKKDTIVYADVKKTHSHHRVFSTNRYLRVPANDVRPIQVWDESLVGTPEAKNDQIDDGRLYKTANRVSIAGWADNPFDSDCHMPALTGGVGLQVWARRATSVLIQASQSDVRGKVIYQDTRDPVAGDGAKLLIEMIPAGARRNDGKDIMFSEPLPADGSFGFKFDGVGRPERPAQLQAVVVHFLGGAFGGPAEGEHIF